jgi:hypothetical protein
MHGGFGYFFFCRAVQRLQLDARCYATDTWKGDEYAGFWMSPRKGGTMAHGVQRSETSQRNR